MATSDKLNLRMTFADGSNANISIPDYKENSATRENLQTLANAAADVLETTGGSAFTSITNAVHVVTSETNLNDVAGLPLAPSN